ncbi:Panacea domain-containing protein [Leuconostoc mesenteroides]|uniref:Panacea domain-containing protein n=1 Tax=Leuconostoc mesenteroides TaxID=1245 RepID=UPI00235E6EE9|nr:type II toxin-antitoxin system antitoxin SocA domain-containing protein [Leuconostoc mesenteroides]
MAEFDSLQVVNWFRAKNVADMRSNIMVEPLTQMKVMKLMYYAQGIMLAAYDKKLFSDDIVAWKYGPVVEKVHETYKGFREIVSLEDDDEFPVSEDVLSDFDLVTKDQDALIVLETVMEEYGDKSAIELMNMTHNETPWKTTDQSAVMSVDSIKKYFKENILA